MKEISAEELLTLASLFSIKFADECNDDDLTVWGDFFSVVGANLVLISDRRQALEAKTEKKVDS